MRSEASRAAFAALSEGVVVQDDRGRIFEFNAAAPVILGLTEGQLLGRDSMDPRWQSIHEDGTDFPGSEHPAMRALRSGREVRDVVMGLKRPDGTQVWLLVNAVPFEFEGVRNVVASFADITGMTTLRHALQVSEERFRLLAENSTDVVVHIREGGVVWASPALEDVLGWAPGSWEGTSLTDYIHPEDVDGYRMTLARLTRGATLTQRTRFRSADGAYRTMECRSRTFLDGQGRLDGTLMSFYDVEDEVRAEELRWRATHDDLTGLLTREEMFRRLQSLIDDPHRTGSVAVAFCDVDDFKAINDGLGHQAGDEVLTALTRRMSESVRRSDSLARIGGDEILAVCVEVNSLKAATRIGEALREVAAESVATGHGEVRTSVSIGMTLLAPGDSVASVIDRADQAMYTAKNRGKNCVVAV